MSLWSAYAEAYTRSIIRNPLAASLLPVLFAFIAGLRFGNVIYKTASSSTYWDSFFSY